MSLAERLNNAMAESGALAAYRRRPGHIIGHCRNWPRIIDHGHATTEKQRTERAAAMRARRAGKGA